MENVKVILWKGHCSVHENFTVANVQSVREQHPDMKIIVHPECSREVVALSDMAGSTNYIINAIEKSEPGYIVGDWNGNEFSESNHKRAS